MRGLHTLRQHTPSGLPVSPLVSIGDNTILSASTVERLAELCAMREELRQLAEARALAAAVAACADAHATLETRRRALLGQSRDDALRLAIAIAKRILRAEVERAPEQLALLVHEEVGRIGVDERPRLLLGPLAHRVLGGSETLADAAVVEEIEAEPWTIIVRSGGGEIELGLEHQLRRVAAALGLEPEG